MTKSQTAHPRDPHYGWVIVATSAFILAVSVGVTFYGLSIYLTALTEQPSAFSLDIVSIATGMFLLVSGAFGLVVGYLLSRFDARLVICGGTIVCALALLALGHVTNGLQLIIVYGVLGSGFAATSVIPTSSLIANWFDRRRPMALSIAFIGLPIGGAVLTPPIAWIVENEGVQDAGPWLALALVIGIMPASILLKPRPRTQEAPAFGAELSRPLASDGVPLKEAVHSMWFKVVTLALTLGMLSQLGMLTHLYNAVSERLDAASATAAVSLLASASLIGRLIGGWALSYVVLRTVSVVLLLIQSAAIAWIAVAPSLATVLIATALFGLTMGNMQILQPLLLADQFGTRDFGQILARGNFFVMIGTAMGPLLVSSFHNLSDDYLVGLFAAALPAALGAGLMVWSRRFERKQPQIRRQAATTEGDLA